MKYVQGNTRCNTLKSMWQSNAMSCFYRAILTHRQGMLQPRAPDFLGPQKCLESKKSVKTAKKKPKNVFASKIYLFWLLDQVFCACRDPVNDISLEPPQFLRRPCVSIRNWKLSRNGCVSVTFKNSSWTTLSCEGRINYLIKRKRLLSILT